MTRKALRAAVQPHLEQDFDALYDEFIEEHGADDAVGFLAHLAAFNLIAAGTAKEITDSLEGGPAVAPPPAWNGPTASTLPGPEFDDGFEDEAHTVVGDDPIRREFHIPDPTPEAPPPRGAEATFDNLGDTPAPVPGPPPLPPNLGETATPFPAPRVRAPAAAADLGGAPAAATETTQPSPSSDNRGPATAPRPIGLDSAAPLNPPPSPSLDDDEEWEEDDSKTKRTMFRRQTDGALRQQTDVVEVELKESRKRRRRRAPPADTTPPVGEEGRYAFVGVVGEGAMGKIHLAADSKLQRKVAFKAMSAEIAEIEQLARKFAAEARITAQLDHPNIVPVYNLETAASYTMKLIKGITVEDIIQETLQRLQSRKPLDEVHTLEGRLELFLRACDALYYAHSRGVVHRDLKPENIMVGEFNELYVMDWGIARLMNGSFEDKVVTGVEEDNEGDLVIGTPGYMSPEQAEGQNETLDGHSDQYSLGLILFELISLTPAVTGKAPLKIVMRHQDGEKDPMVHAAGQRIPRELKAIVNKATAKDPARRYASVKHLSDDIKRYLRGDPTIAAPDNIFQAGARWMGRHRQATAFVAFATIGLFGFIAVSAIALTQIQLANARAREQERSNLLANTAAQSSIIDGQFLKYEGLVSLVATHAEDSLARPSMGNPRLYKTTDFDTPGAAPPDVVKSSRYGRPISLGYSAYGAPPDVPMATVLGSMAQLQSLDRHYYRVLLRSHSEAAATYTPKRAERALADVGVPIARAYVGLASGLHQSYPGHGQWPADYDPRTTAWYELAKSRRGPNWGAPSVDLHGLGLVLTCAQALYDTDDNLLGVAGVDVTFNYIIEELLELPGFERAPGAEAFLLDAEGHIVVRSSRSGDDVASGADGRTLQLRDFGNADVVKAVTERRSGYTESGKDIVVYNRMNSIGWYYVVSGPEDELLELASE